MKSQLDNIGSYLNDHLAGSVAALELIDDLIKNCGDESLKEFLSHLGRDIESDQKILKQLLASANEDESALRQAAAWISEKFVRLKFKLGGEKVGGFGLLEAMEALAIGIRGKELLWGALTESNWSPLRNVDLARLQQRAREQQQRLEEKRLEAARQAFS